MPCNHRFINDLVPNYPLTYLFVGTFNPCWNNPNGNNASWFYGRGTNDFWYIMPQVFGHESLMDAEFRNNRNFLINWCQEHSIGITDMISSVEDADEHNPEHANQILSMLDTNLENFNNITPNTIHEIIEANQNSLEGIYLTRFEHTLAEGGVLSVLWNSVIASCDQFGISHGSLVTPSRGYHVITRDQKLQHWQQTILHE